MQGSIESFNSTIIATATTTIIKTGGGNLGGVFFSASTSGTVTIYDGLSASGTKIVAIFTGVAATYYPLPIGFGTGLTVVTGGTVSCSILWI